MTEQAYVYRSTLKQTYGLPDSWIAQLGQPDKMAPNPYYRSAPAVHLYLRQRVEAFIESNQGDYEAMIAQRKERQVKGQVSASRRAAELLLWAETARVRLVNLPETWDGLMAAAEKSFYGHRYDRDDFGAEFVPSRNAAVAYVRHELSNYHDLLGYASGKPGAEAAYLKIKERVNQTIERKLKELYDQE